jgi:formamidopyrimidine-DNA glycosylase
VHASIAQGHDAQSDNVSAESRHPHHENDVPELPEVERATQLLRKALLKRVLTEVRTHHPSARRALPDAVARSLEGHRVVQIERRAKYQLLTLDDARIIEVHFKMTGDWAIGPVTLPPPRLGRVTLLTDDDTRISLVDGRAFAVVRVHPPGATVVPPLGPEPLEESWTATYLHEALMRRHGPIKPVLLDQRVVAGLGNIYAAEALWEAGIHPLARASRLSRARVARLVDAARLVLERAPSRRYYGARATDDGYTYALGDGDDEAWRVYDRAGQSCDRCGAIIRSRPQAGRTTYYCGGCQRI